MTTTELQSTDLQTITAESSDTSATIYIVDDNKELTEALSLNLQREGYKVVTYNSAKDFLLYYSPNASSCNCLLLDVRMPEMSGDELHKKLLHSKVTIPIIFLSGYSDVPVVVDSLRKGAIDFLTKPVDQHTLLKSIHTAIAIDIKQRKKQKKTEKVITDFKKLSKREHEVVKLLVNGCSNRDIHKELDISINTVENHRSKIMLKMRAKNISELVCLCLINGLVSLNTRIA